MNFAYYNGVFAPFEEIRIPLSDRSVFFGDGVYDACIGRGGRIYLLKEHVERFFGNARRLMIPIPCTEEKFSHLLYETIEKSGIDEFFLYFQLSGSLEERVHAPKDRERSNLLITVKPHTLPEKSKMLKLISYPDRRQRFCNVKSINLLGSVMASEEAVLSGADEAVLVRDSYVTECAHSNVSIVKDGVLITHPCDELILPGITRAKLILCARQRGIPVNERPFSLSELISSDGVIVTSTSKLALSASEIDGIALKHDEGGICKTLIDDMFKCYHDFC